MAEHQLPKLTVRVRFPSPAPCTEALVRTDVPPGLPSFLAMLKQGWAISGPLARGGGRSVALGGPLRLAFTRLALGCLDGLVDRVGDALVGLPVGVLVDQRGTRAVVPIRAMMSRRLAPGARDASVLPVCRRS